MRCLDLAIILLLLAGAPAQGAPCVVLVHGLGPLAGVNGADRPEPVVEGLCGGQ